MARRARRGGHAHDNESTDNQVRSDQVLSYQVHGDQTSCQTFGYETAVCAGGRRHAATRVPARCRHRGRRSGTEHRAGSGRWTAVCNRGRYDTPIGLLSFDDDGEVKVEPVAVGMIRIAGSGPARLVTVSTTIPPPRSTS